ncbi:MAG: TIGR01458 family HAD-type hydrolase [Actinomycetota bacterium]|nr:TIGR01458 family HAD-type hydrolase [Actinomycetota bacterium]
MTALAGAKGILLDLDGVLTTSGQPLDGALDAIAWLRTTGMPFKILTNTTTKTRQDLCSQLKESGFDLQADELLTAATAAADYLRRHHPGARCFLITKSDLSADFEDVEVTDADADVVVIGGAEDAFTYANLNHAFQMLMNGAVLLAMHRGLYWQTDRGLMLDAGAYVRGLEEAAGVEATLVGKPARSFFDSAVAALGVPAEGIVMVGDNVTSDVNGAQLAGLLGVLVRTGSFRPDQLERAEREPDAVIDSIGDFPALLG